MELFSFQTGLLKDRPSDPYPSAFWAWDGGLLELPEGGTHFGFLHRGSIRLVVEAGSFELGEGMFFAVPGKGRIEGRGQGIAVTRWGVRGFFHLGGPIEEVGRLRYIDGCTDSLLIPPVLRGDPCLNLLHFPPQIHQTEHTHPSLRFGMITKGQGLCHLQDRTISLRPGVIFLLPAEILHCFSTADHPMTVIAYHPDSDFGPTHESHPMINRTIVGGISASQITSIQTQTQGKTK